MPKHLVISTSGNPDSNSRRMGQKAFAHLQKHKIDCDWIDIREMELPLVTAGDDIRNISRFLRPGNDFYTAAEVIEQLLDETPATG